MVIDELNYSLGLKLNSSEFGSNFPGIAKISF